MTRLLLVARASLRQRGLTETLRRLTVGKPVAAGASSAEALRALHLAGRMVHAPCLAQSVALTAALTRARKTPVLVLGARRYEDRRWGAHAWVEVGDDVLDPVPTDRHDAFARLDATTGWVPVAVK